MAPAPSLPELIHLVDTESEDATPLGRLRAASALAGHLADVGDAALGHFVDQARHAGHSWSQIGEALGVSKQAAQQRHTVRQASSVPGAGFERFTPRAVNAVGDAEVIAREWGHDHVGTEHLLLSLYRDPHGLAAQILVESGLSEEQVTEAVEQRVARGSRAREGQLQLTPKAMRVLDDARAVAGELGHGHVGTEHLLIGLDRIDGTAKQVLEQAGLASDELRQRVVAKLAPYEQRMARSTDRASGDEQRGVR